MVWFGENLDEQVVTCKNIPIGFLLTNPLKVLDAAHEELEECDLCLVVGTSSVVYPAAMFAPQVTKIWINKCLAWAFYVSYVLLRLRQGGFQLQNSTWRPLLLRRDLEDMAFSSKYSL